MIHENPGIPNVETSTVAVLTSNPRSLGSFPMKFLPFWLFMTAMLGAESLDILVIDVDKRLVEPTLTRALAKDRANLEDALEKLRKLAPDKGVVVLASFALDIGEEKEKIGKSGIEFAPDLPGRGAHYRRFGWTISWDPEAQSRKLEVIPRATMASAPLINANLVHPLDARWSLSAAVTTPKGAVFIFEKITGREPLADEPVWVASALIVGGKNTDHFDLKPERWLSDTTPIRSSILREPPKSEHHSSIALDLKPFCGAWNNYSESSVTFSAKMGTGKEAGLLVSQVDLRYLDELQASTHTEYSGSFKQAFGTGKLPIHSSAPFDPLTRLVERKGTTTTSTPQPDKKSKQHLLRALVFRNG